MRTPMDYYKVYNSFHDVKKNEHVLNTDTENNEFNDKNFIYDDINKSTIFNMPKIRNDNNATNIINAYYNNVKKEEEVTNTSTLNSSNVLKFKHDHNHYINMTNGNKSPVLYENNNIENVSDDDKNKRKIILNTLEEICSVNDNSVHNNSLGLHENKHMTRNEDFIYSPNKMKEMVHHDNVDYDNEQLKKNDIYKKDIYKNDIYKNDIYKNDIYINDIYKKDIYKNDIYKNDMYKNDMYKNDMYKNDMYNYTMIKNNTINNLNFIDKINSPIGTNKNVDSESTLKNNNNNNNYVYNFSLDKQLFEALNNHNEKIHPYTTQNVHNNKEQEDSVSTFCKNNMLNENKNETYMNNKQFNNKQVDNDNNKNSLHHNNINNNFNSKNIENFLNETNVQNVFNSNENLLNYLKGQEKNEQENPNEEKEERDISSENRKRSQEKKISYNKFHNFDFVNNYDLSMSSIMNNKTNSNKTNNNNGNNNNGNNNNNNNNNNNDINSVNKMNDVVGKLDGNINNNNYYQSKEGDYEKEKDKREININELLNDSMNNNMINGIHLNKFDEKMIDLILNNGNKCYQKGDDMKDGKFSNVINLNNIHLNDDNSVNNNMNSSNYMLYDVLSEHNNMKNDIQKNEHYNNGYNNKQNMSPSNNSLNDRNNNYYKMDYRNKKNINANRNLTMNLPNLNNNNNNMKILPNGNFVNNENVKGFFKTNNVSNNNDNNNMSINSNNKNNIITT
ncbi:hypothetical protein PFLG_01635, partial [Plasmodium falciparum RAJ116]